MLLAIEKSPFDSRILCEALIPVNIHPNGRVLIYHSIKSALNDFLSIHCKP